MLITAIGELLIDLTHAGFDPQGVELFAANPGGAPANVAAACAKLGAESAFIGRVGKDAFGESAVRLLRSCGVDTSGVSFDVNAPTTLAVVSLDGQGERSFQFYRDMGADTRLAREHVPDGMIASSRVLHFGSLSLTHEPCRSALLHALDVAEANGVLRSYDANYRASLWHGEGEAVEAMRYLLHRADIVKLSAEELALLAGGEGGIEAAARRVLECGCALLFVTCGAEGAYWAGANSFGFTPAEKIAAVDTNGAGDSFMGAALTRLAGVSRRELRALGDGFLREVTAFASRAAAITCTRYGTIPALPASDEL
ncbi:MAG: carbohydrate kinase family protein [Oscillospiraceae bacterium]